MLKVPIFLLILILSDDLVNGDEDIVSLLIILYESELGKEARK
jgi:hypothetical protein